MKSDKELAVEIVVAVVNANIGKPDEKANNGTLPLTTNDIPLLVAKIYETLASLDSSDSSR